MVTAARETLVEACFGEGNGVFEGAFGGWNNFRGKLVVVIVTVNRIKIRE